MIDLYVEEYTDIQVCNEHCMAYSTQYYVSDKPFMNDASYDNAVVFGDAASCNGSADGSWDDVIKYTNEKYSTNIMIDDADTLNLISIIDGFKEHGINLHVTYDDLQCNELQKVDYDSPLVDYVRMVSSEMIESYSKAEPIKVKAECEVIYDGDVVTIINKDTKAIILTCDKNTYEFIRNMK